MLRSYQYTEKSYFELNMQSDNFRYKEVEIARKYVQAHPIRRDMNNVPCPVCRKNLGKYFYTKWNVDYLRCEECRSIYAVYDEDVAAGYQRLEELKELRLSDTYQEQITKSRSDMWDEFLEWAEIRTFRFLKKNKVLKVIDFGNRLSGYTQKIRTASFCGKYDLRESILENDSHMVGEGEADIVFWFDQLQKEINPHKKLQELRKELKSDGLLFIGSRAGSGFDILTLKENNTKIYPYEHILLVSVKGLTKLLEDNGFEILEVTTPGVMDVKYVKESIAQLDEREGFIKYLLEESSQGMLQEFQRFLQKGCLSSFVRVIARRKSDASV